MNDLSEVELSELAEMEIETILDGMSDPHMRRAWETKLRKIFLRKAENAVENRATFNEAYERALTFGSDDPFAYAQMAVSLAVREKIHALTIKRIIKAARAGEARAADHEAEVLERASKTANPLQRRKAQDDRKYVQILGEAQKSGTLGNGGLVGAEIKKKLGRYRLPHWEKTTLSLKVVALAFETAKRPGRTINLRISDTMAAKALGSTRGPVSFVQNQVRERLKRRFASDAPEFWFVMERDNDRRFHLHGAYEAPPYIDYRHVDAALRDAAGWDAVTGAGLAQVSAELDRPFGWAAYVVKQMNLTAGMTPRRLLGASAEIKASARGGWDALRKSLPQS